MGTIRLHKLCQNKHFSTACTTSPKFKKKNIFLLPKCHSFQLLTWPIKTSFSFSLLRLFPASPVILLLGSSSSFLAGDLHFCSFEINTQFLWHSLFAILKSVFRHEIRNQMSLYFETMQTVIQSTPMADFNFGFPEGRFLPLNGQKHLRSIDYLISNKQERPKRIYKKRRKHGHSKTLEVICLNRS